MLFRRRFRPRALRERGGRTRDVAVPRLVALLVIEGAQARDGARGYGPPPVGKQHGLYVVDVGDGSIGPCPLDRPSTARRDVTLALISITMRF